MLSTEVRCKKLTQAIAYKNIMVHMYPNQLSDLLKTRIDAIFQEKILFDIGPDLQILPKLEKHEAHTPTK